MDAMGWGAMPCLLAYGCGASSAGAARLGFGGLDLAPTDYAFKKLVDDIDSIEKKIQDGKFFKRYPSGATTKSGWRNNTLLAAATIACGAVQERYGYPQQVGGRENRSSQGTGPVSIQAAIPTILQSIESGVIPLSLEDPFELALRSLESRLRSEARPVRRVAVRESGLHEACARSSGRYGLDQPTRSARRRGRRKSALRGP